MEFEAKHQDEEEFEIAAVQSVGVSSGQSVRTFAIFREIPVHFEFGLGYLPIFSKSMVIHFKLDLRNPRRPKKVRRINGPYIISDLKLVYSNEIPSRSGLSQYLELIPYLG